jgi:hypothetical protein
MGVGGQCHTLAAVPLGKPRYPLYRWLGWPQSWFGQVWKIVIAGIVQIILNCGTRWR